MTRTDGPIPGAESAAQPPEPSAPHVSAGKPADPVDRLLGRLLGAPLWPVVYDEDQETTCPYGDHEAHLGDCDLQCAECAGGCPERPGDCNCEGCPNQWVPLGPIPGEPDYDENYHDQQKDEAA